MQLRWPFALQRLIDDYYLLVIWHPHRIVPAHTQPSERQRLQIDTAGKSFELLGTVWFAQIGGLHVSSLLLHSNGRNILLAFCVLELLV